VKVTVVIHKFSGQKPQTRGAAGKY